QSVGNVVQGNFIGTNRAGASSLANFGSGIDLFDAPDNTIGGTTPGSRNVISGNSQVGAGVVISGAGATGNIIEGNFIGTDSTGANAVGNSSGVVIIDATGNTIGGTEATTPGGPCSGACNLISGNTNEFEGVVITGAGAVGNLVQGNY